MSLPARPVLVDVQATQAQPPGSRAHNGPRVGLVAAAPLDAQLLNRPEPPGSLSRSSQRRLGTTTAATSRGCSVVSPIELDVRRPASRGGVRPAAGRDALGPHPSLPDRYLADPGLRRYRTPQLCAAGAVLASRSDLRRSALGAAARRVRSWVRLLRPCSRRASRPSRENGAAARARGAVRSLHGWDGRPEELPRALPRVGPLAARGARRLAARDGVQHGRADAQPSRAPCSRSRDRVAPAVAGFVPDAALRLLYQSTDLSCSLPLRGLRAPGGRSAACGARTIGSGTSAVAELLVPAARFDPPRRRDCGAIEQASPTMPARAPRRAVTPSLPRWDVVADRGCVRA